MMMPMQPPAPTGLQPGEQNTLSSPGGMQSMRLPQGVGAGPMTYGMPTTMPSMQGQPTAPPQMLGKMQAPQMGGPIIGPNPWGNLPGSMPPGQSRQLPGFAQPQRPMQPPGGGPIIGPNPWGNRPGNLPQVGNRPMQRPGTPMQLSGQSQGMSGQGFQQQPIMQPTPPIQPNQMSNDAMSAALRRQY